MRSLSKISEMRVRTAEREVLPDALRQVERDPSYGNGGIMRSVAKAMAIPAIAIAVTLSPGLARADNSSCLATEQNIDAQIADAQKSIASAQQQLQQWTSIQNPNSSVQSTIAALQQVVSTEQGHVDDFTQQLSELQCDQPQAQPSTPSTGQQPATSPTPSTQPQSNTQPTAQPSVLPPVPQGNNDPAPTDNQSASQQGQPQAPQPQAQTQPTQPQANPQPSDPAPASQPVAQTDPAAASAQPVQTSAPSIDSYSASISGGYNIYGHGELWDVPTDALQIYWSNVETTGSGMQIYMAKSAFGSGNLKNIDSSIVSDINSSSFTLFDTSGYGLAQTNGPNIMYSAQDVAKGLGIDISDWGTTYKTIFVAIVDPTAMARTQYLAVPLHAMVQQGDVTTGNNSTTNAGSPVTAQTQPTSSVPSGTAKADGQTALQKAGSGQGATTTTSTTTGTGSQQATTTTVGSGTASPAQGVNATQAIGAAKDAGTVIGSSGDAASKLGKLTGNDMLKAIGDDLKSVGDAISIVTRDTEGMGEAAMGEGGDYGLIGALAGLIDAEYGNSMSKAFGVPDYRLCDPALLFSACRK